MNIRLNLMITTLCGFMSATVWGQTPNPTKTIANLAIQLTGKWKLIGVYKDNRLIETQMGTSYNSDVKGESTVKVFTDTGLVNKVYLHKKLIKTEKTKHPIVLDLWFEKDGLGGYFYYMSYNPDNEEFEIDFHSPIPVIKYKKGKYVLEFVELAGTYDVEFKVFDDKLILWRNGRKEPEEWYEKLKD